MDENDSAKLLYPELRGRSTGSMVTNFVLGITFSHKILKKKSVTLATAAVRLRRPLAT